MRVVNPHVAFGMKLRRLLDALHPRNVRKHHGQQSRFLQQLESAPCGAFGQQLGQFIANAFGGNLRNLRGEALRRRHRFRLNLETESRRKPHGPHHAQFIFRETQPRIANRAHNARPQIGAPADIVKHFARRRVHQQSIDREIAPPHIFLRSIRVNHLVRMPPIGVANVGAKRGHLDLRAHSVAHYLLASVLKHQNHAKFRAHRKAARKKLLHALRPRIRANVIIRRLAPQLQIAHTPAHEIRLMPVRRQRRANPFGQFTRSHA